ncbi:MAG: hypothetical protein ACRCZK_02565 [Oscillospiraceae bacterium]
MNYNDLVEDIIKKVSNILEDSKQEDVNLLRYENDTFILNLNDKDLNDFKEENFKSYKKLIINCLDNETLSKVAFGILDTYNSRVISEFILSGKEISVNEENVELFKYREKSNKIYYKMLLNHLEFLENCGLKISGNKKVKGNSTNKKETSINEADRAKDMKLYKKLISEMDIKGAYQGGVTQITIEKSSIITPLAKDALSDYNIKLIII